MNTTSSSQDIGTSKRTRCTRASSSSPEQNQKETWESLVHKIKCSKEDPGIAIEYADDNTLHQVCALPNSLVPQGANAAASAVAFRTWMVEVITGICPNSAVPRTAGGFSDAHFQHLTLPEYAAVLNAFTGNTALPWNMDCLNQNFSAGRFFQVSHKGRGFNAMDEVQLGPFRG